MPYSTSVTRGSHTIEEGGVRMGDEAELARMGYKQELKYVQVNFMRPCPSILTMLAHCQTRSDLVACESVA